MQGMFKDEFQYSSACCLATDFNSFQQNQCGAAGAGDFKATKPGEAWMSTCTEDKDLFLASGPPEPPAPAASLVQLFASLGGTGVSSCPLGGYKHIKEQEINY